jgi:hypothetical protein
MQTLLSGKEGIFAGTSLKTETSNARTHLICGAEGVTEGLWRHGHLPAGTMVGFGGSFIEQKEDLDGYHACC